MDRLWEAETNVAIRDVLEPAVPAFELLTHLGDGAFLIVLGVLIYWFGGLPTRRERAFVIAIGIAALALSTGLKGVFQLPRPAVFFAPEAYPGYTFPSAHAMGAAAIYGALAVTIQSGRRWQRYLIAATIVFVVALSRVVIGLHFVGDVIVGVALGLGLVWLGLRWRQEGELAPGMIFGLAAFIAVAGVVLGSRAYLTMSIGASVGGLVGWYAVIDRPTSTRGAAIALTGTGVVLGLILARIVFGWLGSVIPGGAPDPGVLMAETAAYVVLTALVLAVPTLAIAIEDRPLVARLQRRLPFRGRRVIAQWPGSGRGGVRKGERDR